MLWLFFSQYKKNFVNNKTPKEHGEKTNTYLHKLGHLAITNSETQQKSYKAQTNTIIKRGPEFGGHKKPGSDIHYPMRSIAFVPSQHSEVGLQ